MPPLLGHPQAWCLEGPTCEPCRSHTFRMPPATDLGPKHVALSTRPVIVDTQTRCCSAGRRNHWPEIQYTPENPTMARGRLFPSTNQWLSSLRSSSSTALLLHARLQRTLVTRKAPPKARRGFCDPHSGADAGRELQQTTPSKGMRVSNLIAQKRVPARITGSLTPTMAETRPELRVRKHQTA